MYSFAVSKLLSGQFYKFVLLDKSGNKSTATEYTYLSTSRAKSLFDLSNQFNPVMIILIIGDKFDSTWSIFLTVNKPDEWSIIFEKTLLTLIY